jgi:phage baseplate assembly protein V
LQRRTRGTMHMDCPAVGDNVKVTRLSGGLEEGFVDGAFYTTENPPPQIDPDLEYIEFGEGSTILFDPNGGGLVMNLQSPAIIETTAAVSIKSGAAVTIEAAANVDITATGTMTLRAQEIVLDTPLVTIPAGDMMQPGGEHIDATGVHV